MQIMQDVYQISGVPFRTNSNSYVVNTGKQLILIDAGFSELQWHKMQEMLKFWRIDHLPITHTFFTHSHFDHAGNAWMAKKIGSRILAGPSDAEGMEIGDERCIGHMFGRTFVACPVDEVLTDEAIFGFEDVKLTAYHMPGHSQGSMMFEVELHDRKVLFMGDFLAIEPAAPEDDVKVLLAWTGGPDFSAPDYLNSLKRAAGLEVDILCPGHYHLLYGECNRILRMAYEKGKTELDL